MGFSVSTTPRVFDSPHPPQKATTKPAHMYPSPSGYIFRLRIPHDIKPLVGKVEFRYSLRTGALRIAKHRARCITAYIQQLFIQLRGNMFELTQDQVNQLVRDYIRQTLANDERCRATGEAELIAGDESIFPPLEGSDMKADEARSMLTSINRWLKQQNHTLMEHVADKLVARGDSASPKDSVDREGVSYKVLCRELMKGMKDVLGVRILRAEGDYTKPDEDLIPALKADLRDSSTKGGSSVSPGGSPSAECSAPAVSLSEVQEHYLVEVERAESWTTKTKEENLATFSSFISIVGDLPIDKIDRRTLSEFKSVIMKLPTNMNNMKQYKGKSIQEVIAMNPEKTLAVGTVNKYLIRLGGLFNYAVRNGYMQSNPAAGQQIKRQKRADQERPQYTLEDLKKIFHSEEYMQDKHQHDYCHWTPLIALYSGCRREEICQLHLEDIRQITSEAGQAVWVFDINEKHEKKLKTPSSERLVPIHPKLIHEHGLLEYVEKLKAKGEQRLFPELQHKQNGYGETVSKWFGKYKKKCGIEDGKTFHSFRHTFITHLKHKQVDPFMIHELDGHSINSETMGRYGKRYTPEILLKEAILKIDYGL